MVNAHRSLTGIVKSSSALIANALPLKIMASLLAVAIFTVDTTTDLEIAVAALYGAVILLVVRFASHMVVIYACCGCICLTILSYFLTRTGEAEPGLINMTISIVVVASTAFLALRNESAKSIAKNLAQTDLVRDAFIGSVSHELRTPLASILGGVSVLAEVAAVKNDPQLASLVNGIHDEAVRLNNDIQNLLDAALITSEGLRSDRDWTDLKDVIDAAIVRVRLRYPDHRFDLVVDPDLPLVQTDPLLLEQALGQIVSNAAKYSPQHSTISLKVRTEDEGIVISVRDEGLGLTPDERRMLGQRFFRGERHIGKISGSGLGMWIATVFLNQSGGHLEVLSDGAEQGTTVRVILPAPSTATTAL